MRRVIYPSGFEHLPAVRRAIVRDVAELMPGLRGV
jgi:hypothetical protein